MEKFNTWADNYTQVQPFLPLPSKFDGAVEKIIRCYTIGPLIGIIKWIVFLVVLGILVVLDSVINFIPVGIIRRPLLRIVHYSLGRLLLLIAGFFTIDDRYVPSKRGNKTPTNQPGSNIQSGHIILSNHSSYITIIYLLHKFSPQFTITPNFWNQSIPQGQVIPVSFFQMLLSTIYQKQCTSDKSVSVDALLKQTEKEHRGPVVLFPEATTTNGKVLLGCVPVLPNTLEGSELKKIHIIGFKYDYSHFSPVYPAGSFAAHSFWLCTQFTNNIQVRYVIESDVESLEKNKALDEQLYDLLAGSIAVRRAKLLAKEKHSFLEYYYSYYKAYKST